MACSFYALDDAMRLTVEGFALKIARIRRVLDYLGTHLDEDVSLQQLADVACLSASQLERLYAAKVGEPPMATLRRLRLKRAYEQIRNAHFSGERSLMEVAMEAGYASHPAFTRAFTRQFGHAPSRFPACAARSIALRNCGSNACLRVRYSNRHTAVLIAIDIVKSASSWANSL